MLPSRSLKDKRGIVKSILARSRNRFNVSCAETDRQDDPSAAVLAFVAVSPDKVRARSTVERVEEWVYESWPDVEIAAGDIVEL